MSSIMSANSEAENWADIATPHTSRVHTNVRYHPDSWHGSRTSSDDAHIWVRCVLSENPTYAKIAPCCRCLEYLYLTLNVHVNLGHCWS